MNSDLIDRQAAIDALEAKKDKSAKGDIGCFYNTIIQNNIDALKGLPSAQPEINTDGDTISRQAAIDAIKGLPTWWADAGGYYGDAQPPMEALLDPEDAVSAIENLPSAQPDPCDVCKWYDDIDCTACEACPARGIK